MTNAGFILHDAGQERAAALWWSRAQHAAEDAQSWSLSARIHGQWARQRLAMGQPQDTVALTQAALEGDRHDTLTPTERAMLYALQARAYAAMNDVTATTVAIAQADGYWHSEATPQDAAERPWVAHYDEAHHYGDIASAQRELVKHGHRNVSDAAGGYEHAALHQQPGARRTKVMNLLDLAALEVQYGDVQRGVSVAHEALNTGVTIQSKRVTDRYTDLYKALSAHATQPGVPDVQSRIRDLVSG